MPLFNSTGIALVPDFSPPNEYLNFIPGYVRRNLGAERVGSRRLIEWTIALSVEFQRRYEDYLGDANLHQIFPSYGFLDPDFEQDKFGVIIHHIDDPMTPWDKSAVYEDNLRIGDITFPVVRRFSAIVRDASKMHPASGTGTCMARSRKRGKKELNTPTWLVTAEHVVHGKDDIDVFDSSGRFIEQGAVDLTASSGIDAATIKVTSQKVGARLHVVDPVPQWMDIELITQWGIMSGAVSSVTDMRGSLSSYIPGRVFINVHGKGGDSGSPVIDKNNPDRLVGIYMGFIMTKSGIVEGICQHAAQAEADLGVNFFRGV